MKVDFLLIGGGLAGMSLGYQLQKSGKKNSDFGSSVREPIQSDSRGII